MARVPEPACSVSWGWLEGWLPVPKAMPLLPHLPPMPLPNPPVMRGVQGRPLCGAAKRGEGHHDAAPRCKRQHRIWGTDLSPDMAVVQGKWAERPQDSCQDARTTQLPTSQEAKPAMLEGVSVLIPQSCCCC